MARIIYSALIESIRGSIAGTTFQSNKYGYTVKKKPRITKPNSEYQNRTKRILSIAVKAWNDLTVAQRTDWDTWASTYPQYAKHNPSAQLSGFAVFVRSACYYLLEDYAIVTNPSYTIIADTTPTFALANAAGVLNLTISGTDDAGDWDLWIFLSRPFRASQSFVGTKTRYVYHGDTTNGTTAITAFYQSQFGIIPSTDDLIAVDCVQANKANGQVKARTSTILTVG